MPKTVFRLYTVRAKIATLAKITEEEYRAARVIWGPGARKVLAREKREDASK